MGFFFSHNPAFADRNKAGFTIFDVANEHLMSETALYLWKHGVKSVRKRSKKVVEHQRVYMIHGPHIREYVSSIGVYDKL